MALTFAGGTVQRNNAVVKKRTNSFQLKGLQTCVQNLWTGERCRWTPFGSLKTPFLFGFCRFPLVTTTKTVFGKNRRAAPARRFKDPTICLMGDQTWTVCEDDLTPSTPSAPSARTLQQAPDKLRVEITLFLLGWLGAALASAL